MPSQMEAIADEELPAWKPRMGRLTVAEKLQQGETLKRQGNFFVKSADPKRALRSYAQVFAYVNGLSVQGDSMSQYAQGASDVSATPEQGQQIEELKVAVWSNMALCQLKLQTPEKALDSCDKVLQLQSAHSKARFRKAQALLQLQNYDKSHALLSELLEEEPKNAAVRGEMRKLQQLKKQYDAEAREREKSTFGKMFQ